jgi:[acyl-carrier-protein] S-malonyltransferase
MGAAWRDHPSWELVEHACEVTGRDVAGLLLEADAATLARTDNAQLTTFVSSLVVLDAVERMGLEPTACAGHSLGEYTALTAAGALGYEDGLRLVAERGAAMRDAAENQPGTMMVLLGIDDGDAEAACMRAEGDVWVANYNAPGQVVLAGSEEALATAAAIAKELGAKKSMAIPVSGAFHTPFMAPARDRLRKALKHAAFHDPEPVVFANVDARPHAVGSEWSGLLSAQLCSPVRWRQTVTALVEAGARDIVELGPGGVLTGLSRRCTDPQETNCITVSTPDDLEKLAAIVAGAAPFEAFTEAHAGERFSITERLVVSPTTGLFQPVEEMMGVTPAMRRNGSNGSSGHSASPSPDADSKPSTAITVEVGDLIGHVGEREVRSAFGGVLEGVLVLPGERVVSGQPVAWVRPVASERV